MEISKRQQQVLEYIRKTVKQKGYPPSVREIGLAVGLSSSSTVHAHLEKLEQFGLIRRDPTKPRTIELLDENSDVSDFVAVPHVGRVTAGQPILAMENIEEYLPFPANFVSGEDVFMLTVRGDSMINAAILDGDYILVRKQNTAKNGEIVVALIEDEATVKRFYKEKECIRLQPENDAMEPILVPDCMILGKVVSVFRVVH